MILDELIFDRTQADVTARNARGTYNASDLNRVGGAVLYIAERLLSLGYLVDVPVPKTDWAENDVPRRSEIALHFASMHALGKIPTFPVILPVIPDGGGKLTFTGANDIEEYLYNFGRAEESVRENFVFAGEMFGGEE